MNTTLTIERITHALDKRFGGLIDLSDLRADASVEEQRNAELSRALAALAIMALSEADASAATACITDGYHDLGLDAIYFESADNTLYVVQSKWHHGGQRTIDLGSCTKFLEGMRSLIHADFTNANARLQARQEEVRSILMRTDVRIVVVLVHTGANPLGQEITDVLDRFFEEQNNVGDEEVFTRQVFNLQRVYSNLDPDASKKINLSIGLSEWGVIRQPFTAFYGQMKLSDIADWATHGRALFDRNLRFYRGSTEVNNEMDRTITKDSEKFWYFNNGITVLCEAIDKAPLNGNDRGWGVFQCDGVSVVNGAQTVGVVWERARQNPTLFRTSNACVHVRVISLENCPAGFGVDVTMATNTQNEIKHRDFAALDEIQRNLAREMMLDGRIYAFKSGDVDPRPNEGCTIEEAALALACASGDVTLAILAKREIGGLWKDTTKAPYTTIFNQNTRAHNVWRAVLVLRAFESACIPLNVGQVDRGDQIIVHGNRFLLFVVFQDPQVRRYKDSAFSEADLDNAVVAATQRAFLAVAKATNEKHPGAYLQPLFKNAFKCRELLAEESSEGQLGLFPDGGAGG